MKDLSSFPENHARASGRYAVRLEDGAVVELRIGITTRPLRGNEMARAHIARMTGRNPAMRVEETEISLNVRRSGRMDIKIVPSGAYAYGRHINRSLRELVKELVVLQGHEPTCADDEAAAFRPRP